jgi:NAD-dependent SIR2 family protein deacetylase
VRFSNSLAKEQFKNAIEQIKKADGFLLIDISFITQIAGNFPGIAKKYRTPIIIINKGYMDLDNFADIKFESMERKVLITMMKNLNSK